MELQLLKQFLALSTNVVEDTEVEENSTVITEESDKERLEEIRDELKELANEAFGLVSGTPVEGRAKGYWYASILTAIDDDNEFMGGSSHSLQDSIDGMSEESHAEMGDRMDSAYEDLENNVGLSTEQVEELISQVESLGVSRGTEKFLEANPEFTERFNRITSILAQYDITKIHRR